MKVCVAGGTGLLGRAIVPALIDAGHDVVVLSRSNPAADPIDPRATWVRGDVTDPGGLVEPLRGIDAVVDAVQFPKSPVENPRKGFTFERIDLGGTKNLVDAAKAAGVPRFIGLSGAGAAEDARFHWLRFKWQEEQHIQASGLTYTIFRPSWIFGPRDVSLNRFVGFAKFLPFIPVIGDGKTRLNPLFSGDLARHVAKALTLADAENRMFEIGGPEVLTMDDIIRTALAARGKKRFLLHQPAWLMKMLAWVAQFMPGRPLTPGAIDFILMDPISDTAALTATFGLPLTPLAEALKTY